MKRTLFFSLIAVLASICSISRAEVQMTTQAWGTNDYGAMSEAIADRSVLNFLLFDGSKMEAVRGVNQSDLNMLRDNSAGECGGMGRVGVEGKPAIMAFYLGKVRNIKELAVFTGNIDSRSHQDYEVRFADNSANPGQRPNFSDAPALTTGDKILGAGSGGFLTDFLETEKGKFLAKADWVEIRMWSTYPSKVGDPAKAKNPANSWASLLEVQILGDPEDLSASMSKEELDRLRARMAQQRLERIMRSVSPDLYSAVKQIGSLRMAIEDLSEKYDEDEYAGKKYLAELDKYEKIFSSLDPTNQASVDEALKAAKDFLAFRREALLANPLLDFDKVLVRTAKNAGLMANWMSNCSRGKGNYGNQLSVISIHDQDAPIKPIIDAPYDSFIGDICMKWDAKKILVTAKSENNTWEVYEVDLEKALKGEKPEFKQISPFMGKDVDNVEGCFVPDGSYLFVSSASMMGVPCIGGAGHVGNIFRVEKDLKTCRQLTYEQDQDWNPTLMNDGRIMYLRWEYVDINHYFTRIMMNMNPDGTNQVELYGSGSYWPNSMFYSKPIPGQNAKMFATIVTGHHGVARMGELHIIDPKRGRKEAEGVVQQIPFRDKKVEPIIKDQLVDGSWPKFLFPCPLDENYFLVSAQPTPQDRWGLYLVDTFDNMVLIKESPEFGIFEPFAIQERPCPPVIADRTINKDKESVCYITDVYFGPGLENVPVGTVKKLRVFGYQYGYRGIGNHNAMGEETSWDSKVLLGEVNVEPDGSANFIIPSNVPLALQPLDEHGNALQIMRSWLTGMPGEKVSCSGCHENQNSVTPAKFNMAARRAPDRIVEFNGPKRPVGFKKEVQPVLDKYCVGCHDGSKPNRPNFKDIAPGPRALGNSYWALMPFLRRPGPESDTHMFYPMEYYYNTSPLMQMLRDGNHYNVKMDDISARELALWIDMNMPYNATWSEVATSTMGGRLQQVKTMAKRTQELRALYANVDEDPEQGAVMEAVPRPDFVKPEKWETPNTKNPTGLKAVVNNYEPKTQSIDLGGGVKMDMVYIPSGKFVIGDDSEKRPEANRNEVVIEKPFYMGTTEVTNEMFHQFDPTHESNFIDQQWKDHVHRGYPANHDDQPVIRVTWQKANEFCKWLSEKTGKKFRLPTEAEWEWAAKAGTDKPFWWSDGMGKAEKSDNGRLFGCDVQFGDKANMADNSMRLFVVTGVNPQPVNNPAFWQTYLPRVVDQSDNQMVPGWDADLYEKYRAGYHGSKGIARFAPNPWGLYDMNGNVAEWTQSDYKAYPYNANDGRNAGNLDTEKVVRGGSWNDRPAQCRNGYRLGFPTYQRVYNVGFRVICEE